MGLLFLCSSNGSGGLLCVWVKQLLYIFTMNNTNQVFKNAMVHVRLVSVSKPTGNDSAGQYGIARVNSTVLKSDGYKILYSKQTHR